MSQVQAMPGDRHKAAAARFLELRNRKAASQREELAKIGYLLDLLPEVQREHRKLSTAEAELNYSFLSRLSPSNRDLDAIEIQEQFGDSIGDRRWAMLFACADDEASLVMTALVAND